MKRYSFAAAVAVAVAAVLAVAVSSASAASPNGQTVTQTFTQHGSWQEPGDTDFCTGASVTPTITGNSVEHITYFSNSDEAWGTFTEEGSVVGVIGDLTYTGRITIWGNFNQNERNQNSTFTSSVKLSATDAQGVVHYEIGHEVAHLSWDAVSDQPVVSFDKMYFTCT
jgi:photosystem II stability/assembly factor-like uncharacterized protein